MPKTTDRVTSAAGTAKPYVDRALHDDELREHVKQAYSAARVIYDELIAPRGVASAAHRVATDTDIQDNLRVAVAELRQAAGRLHKGPEKHSGRTLLLLVGVAVGLLYNPVTGPETRRWLKGKLFGGGSDDFGFEDQSGNGVGAA
ncbi:MAG TPA: hypothetical protein VFB35_10245 [Gaiellaceae bacterium]|nr:hypothetical protein [Gaiellaceae bacterium]